LALSIACGTGAASQGAAGGQGSSVGVDSGGGSASAGSSGSGGGGLGASPGAGGSGGGGSGGSGGGAAIGSSTGASPGSSSPAPSEAGSAQDGASNVGNEAGVAPGDGAGVEGDGGVLFPNAIAALGMCTGPTNAKASDAQAAYAKWKTDLVTSSGAGGFRRVLRPNSPGAIDTSNSEGTGYGMILAVAMNDEALFDDLWHYEQLFLDANGLMNWEINPQGTGPTSEGTGAATDADEDMAFALLWADHRWGGKGALADTYHDLAVKQIGLIWQHEVDQTRSDALAPGDQFNGASVINISYFAPAYYRLFGQATGMQSNWNQVVETSYTIIAASLNAANMNASNGLVPAWSTPAGVPQSPNATLPTNYQLDSCRTPFRLGQDYCFYAEPRAKSYLAKISAFYQQIGASHIVNGYELNGTPDPTNPTVNQSAAFVGPAGVGAMSDPMFATLRDQAYSGVATLNELDGSTYYTESWTALSLVMMNGGYWNPALQ
jgi:endo-1,4-beta-D-glucanase Y